MKKSGILNNRKGFLPFPFNLLLLVLLIIIVINIFNFGVGKLFDSNNPQIPSFSELTQVEVKSLSEIWNLGNNYSWLTYIFGDVPKFLINVSSEIGASIIIIAMFIIMLLIFTDILTLFGSFVPRTVGARTRNYTAWTIAFLLTIIVVNLDFLIVISSLGILITGTLGVTAVILGISVPFFAYIVFHTVFFKHLSRYLKDTAYASDFEDGMRELTSGIGAAKGVGRAVSGSE